MSLDKRISTKIIATIGPSSDSYEIIKKMYENGMRIARLNFSHGDYQYFSKIIRNIRKVSKEIAIMADTKGPEIRTGDIKEGEVYLKSNQTYRLTNKKVEGDGKQVYVNYNKLQQLKPRDIILIDDGLIKAQVKKSTKDYVDITILNSGTLSSKKSIIIKGHEASLKFLSSKDRKDIEFAILNKLDYIAASYVRDSKDIKSIKKIIEKHNSNIKVIAKVEHFKAVENIDEILFESHGIMVARGDLGIIIPLEKVPHVQMEIIKKCNYKGKPVIVATQMLESMKESPMPTRAEISDVAQAILQGTDAIMLSGETASGNYPVESVEFMNRISKEYDNRIDLSFTNEEISDYKKPISNFTTKAAYLASKELNAKAIITPTESGFTARKVSRFKPKAQIYAITKNKEILRQLQLSWGVFPILIKKEFKNHEEMTKQIVLSLYENKKVNQKDKVIITAGHIMGKSGHTNLVEIYSVKDLLNNKRKNYNK